MRTYRETLNVDLTSSQGMTVWSRSADKMVLRFEHSNGEAVNLTGYTVGFYLLAGADRDTAECRKPADYSSLMETENVSVLLAEEGLVQYWLAETDVLGTDTVLWMEWYASLYGPPVETVGANAGTSTYEAGDVVEYAWSYILRGQESVLGEIFPYTILTNGDATEVEMPVPTYDYDYHCLYRRLNGGAWSRTTTENDRSALVVNDDGSNTGWSALSPVTDDDPFRILLAQIQLQVAVN